ncbi:MFS transporter [Infirmifilum lucidum]|uniref:MFS transporter n=1 Tax=Infirmifilum lucidum TaxID=2776706 RepID=A0A7L9FI62_9CREN|nr:MFS transporter [Infirmifilum lucidum]QOJ79439.1 MFS transporter [Infirmifilum lucidum]
MRKETLALVLILTVEVLVGSATGVQRTILTVATREALGSLPALLPILSFGVFKATFDLAAGFISHRSGRRASLIAGTLAYFSGTLVILLLKPPLNFVLGNVLVGVGEGIVFATSAIAIGDILGLERSSLTFGYIESACYFGYALGAYVGGWVWNAFGPYETLVYIALSSGLAVLVALSSLETKAYSEADRRRFSAAPKPKGALRIIVTNPSTLSALIAAHMSKVADSIVWGVMPLYVLSRGLDVYYAGYAQSLLLVVWSATMPFWSSYSDRAGRRLVSTLGLMVMAFMLIALPSTRSFPEILLVALALGISYAMYYPVLPAPISDMSPPAVRDIAVGFYRLARDSGYATGAILGSLMLQQSQGSYSSVFVNTGTLLAVTAAFYSVFFRETRPTWPFFDLVIKHLETIGEILSIQKELIKDIFEGRVEEVQTKAAKIKDLERKADRIKRELMWRIWSGLLPVSSRMDFERLVEEIDRVAGAVIECNERLLWVKYGSELRRLEPVIVEMVEETERLSKKLIDNLHMLRLSPAYAVNITTEIDAGERRVDALRSEVLQEVKRLVEEGKVDLMSALNVMEAVNLIELSSDDFQDAADIIRIIAYKHAAIPPERIKAM